MTLRGPSEMTAVILLVLMIVFPCICLCHNVVYVVKAFCEAQSMNERGTLELQCNLQTTMNKKQVIKAANNEYTCSGEPLPSSSIAIPTLHWKWFFYYSCFMFT